MKKICALIVLLVFCLALGGCGKSEAVKNVEAMITGIGTVSVDNLEDVYAALGAYDQLSEEEVKKSENYSTRVLVLYNGEEMNAGQWKEGLSY